MKLDLNMIGRRLSHLEATIVNHLDERVQFAPNLRSYEKGSSTSNGFEHLSYFEHMLLDFESVFSKRGKYLHPHERPYHQDLPPPEAQIQLSDMELTPQIDNYDLINITREFTQQYIEWLPKFYKDSRKEDGGQYGPSSVEDINFLQRAWERIHYAILYVAEQKFQSDILGFMALIEAGDTQEIRRKLQRKDMEIKRTFSIFDKAVEKEESTDPDRIKLNAENSACFYHDIIIPKTLEQEAVYLMKRSKNPFTPGDQYEVEGSRTFRHSGFFSKSEQEEFHFTGTYISKGGDFHQFSVDQMKKGRESTHKFVKLDQLKNINVL